MMNSLRASASFRYIRRTHFVHNYVRPIYAKRLLLNWWAEGRPAPPPHDVKLSAILYLADRIDATVLVETGSYLGDTLRAMRERFDLIISIEIAPKFAQPLQREFAHDNNVRVILGDSGIELPNILAEIKQPTIFWLDAHYSGGSTLGSGYVPIYAEIDTIARLAPEKHAILIDDLKNFDGTEGYPTAIALVGRLRALNYDVATFNNMFHVTNKQ